MNPQHQPVQSPHPQPPAARPLRQRLSLTATLLPGFGQRQWWRSVIGAVLAWSLLIAAISRDSLRSPLPLSEGLLANLALLCAAAAVGAVHLGSGLIPRQADTAAARVKAAEIASSWRTRVTLLIALSAATSLLRLTVALPGWSQVGENLRFLLIGPLGAPEQAASLWRVSGALLLAISAPLALSGRRAAQVAAAVSATAGTALTWPLVSGQLVMGGLALSICLATWCLSLSAVLAPLLAAARISRWPVPRLLASAVIDISRAVPLLVWIFGGYLLLPYVIGQGRGMLAVILAMSVFTASYFAEALRAGLQDLPRGQDEAARSLGLSGTQTLLLITLPQAARRMAPTLLAQSITLFKDTSLVSVVGLIDLTSAARAVANRTPDAAITLYICAAALYFTVSWAIGQMGERLQRRA